MTGDVDVVVVGGGIGGLANAYALSLAGLRVRVLERAAAFGEVGAGLQLAPNATRILREWGLLDEVVGRGCMPRRLVFRDAVDGTELTHVPLRDDVEARYGAPYAVIHRSDLLDALYAACRRIGVDLVTDSAVTDVRTDGRSATAITARQQHTAAVVLAADGLHSTLRARLSPDEPVCSGYVAYRGTVPTADLDADRAAALDDVTVWFAPGCHLVQYPLRGGALLNQVAVFASPAWAHGASTWGTPGELDAAFADTCAPVRGALGDLWRDRWWPMYDRAPISRWVDGRLALTGDAAHPMLQYLAQGACQALEDAYVLAEQVAKGGDGGEPDWDRVLRAYQELREPRTTRIQRTVHVWGDMWHCDGLTRTLRNALFRDRDPLDHKHIGWLWGG
ncbi:FAD-binding protein [Pseudonocardia sp. K10HN5]|uniref:FAD-binding protein n=1 Tax=Pseudonocardia acidicola TaxID=2724939 RepID=A0ABX1S7G9_9PSEU|nr:FAD-binding protein [Pseudonocardia acidicola]